jgi:hypothetical protein
VLRALPSRAARFARWFPSLSAPLRFGKACDRTFFPHKAKACGGEEEWRMCATVDVVHHGSRLTQREVVRKFLSPKTKDGVAVPTFAFYLTYVYLRVYLLCHCVVTVLCHCLMSLYIHVYLGLRYPCVYHF